MLFMVQRPRNVGSLPTGEQTTLSQGLSDNDKRTFTFKHVSWSHLPAKLFQRRGNLPHDIRCELVSDHSILYLFSPDEKVELCSHASMSNHNWFRLLLCDNQRLRRLCDGNILHNLFWLDHFTLCTGDVQRSVAPQCSYIRTSNQLLHVQDKSDLEGDWSDLDSTFQLISDLHLHFGELQNRKDHKRMFHQ